MLIVYPFATGLMSIGLGTDCPPTLKVVVAWFIVPKPIFPDELIVNDIIIMF
jgi:hypothetical protein